MPHQQKEPEYDDDVRLIDDDRLFDVAIVRSALDFLNGEFLTEDPVEAARSFAWVMKALRGRARKADIPLSVIGTFHFPRNIQESRALAGKFDRAMQSIRHRTEELTSYGREPDRAVRSVLLSGRQIDDQWFNKDLKSLCFYQRALFVNDRVFRVSVPILRTVAECLAYALFILLEDQWDIHARIRICRYVKRPGKDLGHWFLDYRLDDEGRLARGRSLEFCSTRHANAFHQREWRKRQADNVSTTTR